MVGFGVSFKHSSLEWGMAAYSLLCIRKVSSVWEKYLVHS